MSENELKREIGRIARESSILEDAIRKMRVLLGVRNNRSAKGGPFT